jgi:hypothetical protein
LARFTLGVRANVQPKSSIPIGAKVEISPKAEKRIPSNLGGQFGTLGANVPAFIDMLTLAFTTNLGPIYNPKMLKVDPKFFWP